MTVINDKDFQKINPATKELQEQIVAILTAGFGETPQTENTAAEIAAIEANAAAIVAAIEAKVLPVQFSIKDAVSGLLAKVAERSQAPFGPALAVQIGPGDPISNIPVVIEFDHHQIHEGEAWKWHFFGAINSTSKDIRISVPTLAATTRTPHVVFEVIADNTTTTIFLYEGTTWTAAGQDDSARIFNRNRNVGGTPNTKVFISGTPALTPNSLGTLIDQGYLFTSKAAVNSERNLAEWDLKSNTEYLLRITTTGNGSVLAKVHFYEDAGV